MKKLLLSAAALGCFVSAHAQWNGSTSTVDPIRRTGNVGIGTSVDPTQKLEVGGNVALTGVRSTIFTRGDADTHRGGLQFLTPNNGSTFVVATTDQNGSVIGNSLFKFGGFGEFNISTVNLAVSGRVGIGTTSLSDPLTVSGGAGFYNGDASNRLVIRQTIEPVVGGVTSIIAGQQRGVLIKDRENMTGGLWLYGGHFSDNFAHRGGVGTGFTSDLGTYYALGSAASATLFVDGHIQFIANNGITQGTRFFPSVRMSIDGGNGNVTIGTPAPSGPQGDYKLNVWGRARANEIVVNTNGADFVFADNYRLRPLGEVEQFITANNHLPEIPSAKEMQQNGMAVGELQTKLLQKVEELTLYVIELKKENQAQQKQSETQQKEIEALRQQLAGSKR